MAIDGKLMDEHPTFMQVDKILKLAYSRYVLKVHNKL